MVENINKCKKCDENIGGKAFYILELDCLFDGESISKCETIYLCSNCYHKLESWLDK